MAFEDLLRRFARDLVARGRRPDTLRGYRSDLRRLAERVDAEGLTGTVIADHVASLASLAASTQARHLSALRSFLTWYDREVAGAGSAPLAPAVRRARTPAVAPASERNRRSEPMPSLPRAVDAALGQIPRQADRDQLFFGLLRHLGLRPGEALALRIEDIADDARHLDVPGRGGRRRRVLVDDLQVQLRLENWRLSSGRRSGALFPGNRGREHVSYQAMAKIWGRYAAAAGVPLQLTDLRRAHYDELVAAGLPLWVVGERLGLSALDAQATDASADSDDIIATALTSRRGPGERRTRSAERDVQ